MVAATHAAEQLGQPVEGLPEGRPVLEVGRPAQLLGPPRHQRPAGAVGQHLVPGLDVVQRPRPAARAARCRPAGGRSSPSTWSSIQRNSGSDTIDRSPVVEHPAAPRVDHQQPRRRRGRAGRTTARPCGRRPPCPPRPRTRAASARSRRRAPRTFWYSALSARSLRRQVAEVLVDPVRRQRADDALLPPGGLPACPAATTREVFQSSRTSWSSKIIDDGMRRRAASGRRGRSSSPRRARCTPRSP